MPFCSENVNAGFLTTEKLLSTEMHLYTVLICTLNVSMNPLNLQTPTHSVKRETGYYGWRETTSFKDKGEITLIFTLGVHRSDCEKNNCSNLSDLCDCEIVIKQVHAESMHLSPSLNSKKYWHYTQTIVDWSLCFVIQRPHEDRWWPWAGITTHEFVFTISTML